MRRVRVAMLPGVVVIMSLTACATSFSAPGVRAEIARQTGAEPREVLEVNAGAVTMVVLRRLVGSAGASDAALPGSRVSSFEIAVYELEPAGPRGARAVDFTLMPVRGWEPTLRYRAEGRSGMVLVRTSGDSVADLVVLASDADGAIYGRLRGTLSKELPAAFGTAIREGGLDAIRRELESVPNEK